MSVRLLPCPFCGGEAVKRRQGPSTCYIECARCECGTKYESDADAADTWNARASTVAALEAENARLREALVEARQTIARPDYGGCNEQIVFGKGFVHADDCRECEQKEALAKIDAALSPRDAKGGG